MNVLIDLIEVVVARPSVQELQTILVQVAESWLEFLRTGRLPAEPPLAPSSVFRDSQHEAGQSSRGDGAAEE